MGMSFHGGVILQLGNLQSAIWVNAVDHQPGMIEKSSKLFIKTR